jgi:tRNA(Ile)-lysidine synthase TilS/MesJ
MADPGLASKYVEAQMEDSERARTERTITRSFLSPLEIERRESVRLSIARTRDQLKSAQHPRHRKLLRRTLKALEAEL